MKKEPNVLEPVEKKRRIKDLVNTPFKKAMFVVQILSYVLILGSPVIGGAIGSQLDWSVAKTGGLVLAIFITGEVLFYGSLFFLGKELLLILKDGTMRFFHKLKRKGKDV